MQRRGVILLHLIWLAGLCFLVGVERAAAEDRWFEGEAGVTVSHITPELARSLAFREACDRALMAAGVEQSGGTGRLIVEDQAGLSDIYAKLSTSLFRGLILEVDTLLEKLDAGPPLQYKVRVRARIAQSIGAPDPGFSLEMNLNGESFRQGDAIVITLLATRDCYVTIFDLQTNDTLSIVAPNIMLPKVRLKAGEKFQIPPDRSFELPAELSPGDSLSSGVLIAVATREDIPFPSISARFSRNLLSFGDGLLRCNKWRAAIPLNKRTEEHRVYRVVK